MEHGSLVYRIPMRSLSRIHQVKLHQTATDGLRSLIVSGSLRPKQRLIEREIAEQLGVSRTPVREAFFHLLTEGLVSVHEGKGLQVSNLSAKEITEIYQALAALERAALLQTPTVSAQMLARLQRASRRRIAARGDVDRMIAADIEWHQALTDSTPNTRILHMLGDLRTLAERYERAFFQHRDKAESATVEHQEIDRLLEKGNLALAAEQIEKHWLGNIDPMVAALAEAASKQC